VIAASHVDLTGLKAAACKYLIMCLMPVWTCSTLAHSGVIGSRVLVCWVGLAIGNFHKPVRGSRGPVINLLLSFLTITCDLLQVASQPASHSVPMEISELCVRLGMMWAACASCGSWGRFNVQLFVLDWMVSPFGRPMVMVFCVVPLD
jgi:hypothetical protein